jgi:predicted esterase
VPVKSYASFILVALSFLASPLAAQEHAPQKGETFQVDDRPAWIYAAPTPLPGRPWVWYAPTLKGVSLVGRTFYFERFMRAGISIAGYDLGEVRGAPGSTAQFSRFYDEMVRRGWSSKPILLGQSRGGMMMLAWGTKNPDKVQAFVGIYPVCNLQSWPLQRSKAATLADFAMPEEDLVRRLREFNPIEHLHRLARARVPMFAVHGDSDVVVPYNDNTGLLKERYEAAGGKIAVKLVPGEGHKVSPSFFECQELADFVVDIATHAQAPRR